jgi:hypothetical protein
MSKGPEKNETRRDKVVNLKHNLRFYQIMYSELTELKCVQLLSIKSDNTWLRRRLVKMVMWSYA